MRSALLRGREHLRTGAVTAVAEGRIAIAISRGGAPKTYAHVDPNEDAAGFAVSGRNALLAVADGHSGGQASEDAVAAILDAARSLVGAPPGRDDWEALAAREVARVERTLSDAVAKGGDGRSRTTLCFALVVPDASWLGWATVGDSHVFAAASGVTNELGAGAGRGYRFLGASELPEVRSGSVALQGLHALVLVTDGLSEKGIGVPDPAAAVESVIAEAQRSPAARQPIDAARNTVEAALAAQRENQAGDNVAVALYLRD